MNQFDNNLNDLKFLDIKHDMEQELRNHFNELHILLKNESFTNKRIVYDFLRNSSDFLIKVCRQNIHPNSN
jgi:hypothetical protein